jgi:uncharacterized integral membrane protein (TIGR00698 family)
MTDLARPAPENPALVSPAPLARPGSLPLGIAACIAIGAVAWLLGGMAPVIGAPVIAIVIGVAISNLSGGTALGKRLRVKDVSGYALRAGIILLGATLNLSDVARTGVASLSLLLLTIAVGLSFALLAGRAMGVDWRMRCLIGMGTTICGASAIAALAPVLRAKTEEIAYSISVIFLFNMLAVFLFPAFGHLMGMSDDGFGLWAGTAVNDTSAVVAAGFAFSKAAGAYATVVKLTRTTLIIPLVLGFGLAMPWLDPEARGTRGDLGARLRKAVPWFIGLFVIASLLNTLGLIGSAAPEVQTVARFVMVVALAAVGLQGHWRAFAGAGLKPLVLGMGTWAAVALTSLAVQAWSGAL